MSPGSVAGRGTHREMVGLDAVHTAGVVELGAKSGQRQRERTHFSSWGLTNTSASCTTLNATASRRFCLKVLAMVFNNQPLG